MDLIRSDRPSKISTRNRTTFAPSFTISMAAVATANTGISTSLMAAPAAFDSKAKVVTAAIASGLAARRQARVHDMTCPFDGRAVA